MHSLQVPDWIWAGVGQSATLQIVHKVQAKLGEEAFDILPRASCLSSQIWPG